MWVLADWKVRGETTPLQLVELGPGRGTLLKDVLRVSIKWNCVAVIPRAICCQVFRHKQLRAITRGLSLHLVEASPALGSIQQLTLQATPTNHTHGGSYKTAHVDDIPVHWYQQLKDVPPGEAIIYIVVSLSHTHFK